MNDDDFISHEIDLRWYFGDDKRSLILERSVMGDLLERASQFGVHESGERVSTLRDLESEVWEHRQRACMRDLEVLTPEDFAIMREAIDALGLDEDDPSLDADIIHESRTVAVRTKDGAILRYAVVSRGVMRCRPSHRRALELYFGPSGNRWIRHRFGRLLALYELTESGKLILVERSRRCRRDGTADDGGPTERFVEEWRHQKHWKDETRKRRFRATEVEARKLLAEAKASYREAVS